MYNEFIRKIHDAVYLENSGMTGYTLLFTYYSFANLGDKVSMIRIDDEVNNIGFNNIRKTFDITSTDYNTVLKILYSKLLELQSYKLAKQAIESGSYLELDKFISSRGKKNKKRLVEPSTQVGYTINPVHAQFNTPDTPDFTTIFERTIPHEQHNRNFETEIARMLDEQLAEEHRGTIRVRHRQ